MMVPNSIKIVWGWLGNNWPQLTSLAALVTTGTFLFAVPWPFQSDVVIRVDRDEFAFPPGFRERLRAFDTTYRDVDFGIEHWPEFTEQVVAFAVILIKELKRIEAPIALKDKAHDLEQAIVKLDDWRSWSETSADELIKRLMQSGQDLLSYVHFGSSSLSDAGRTSITVSNNSDDMVSGIRLRLNKSDDLWDVLVQGSFMTEDREAVMRQELISGSKRDVLVFPEFDLPPDNALHFEIYTFGDPQYSEVSVAIPGHPFSMEEIVETENTWMIKLLSYPKWFILWLFLIIPCILTMLILPLMPRAGRRDAPRELKATATNSRDAG